MKVDWLADQFQFAARNTSDVQQVIDEMVLDLHVTANHLKTLDNNRRQILALHERFRRGQTGVSGVRNSCESVARN